MPHSLGPFVRTLLFLFVLILANGCGKDENPPPVPQETLTPDAPIKSQGDFLRRYMPESQYFTITGDTTFFTKDSTSLTFYFGQFYDASGRIPHNEIFEIVIEIKEISTVQDMIYSERHSEGSFDRYSGISSLVTDRIIYVSPECQKIPLSVSGTYSHMITNISEVSKPIKNLPNSVLGTKRYASNPSSYFWESIPGLANLRNNITRESYSSNHSNLGWMNFAYRYKPNPPFTSLCVDSLGINYYRNAIGYLVYDDVLCVRKIGFGNYGGGTPIVSIGEEATVFIYMFENDRIFLFQKEIVMTPDVNHGNNHLVKTDFIEVTEAELIAAIEAL